MNILWSPFLQQNKCIFSFYFSTTLGGILVLVQIRLQILFLFLFGERKSELLSTDSFPKCLQELGLSQDQIQELETFSRSPLWVAGTALLNLSLLSLSVLYVRKLESGVRAGNRAQESHPRCRHLKCFLCW